jgi:hypothetical protein
MDAAIKDYLAEIKEHKADATFRAYSTALNLFTEERKVTYVDEVGRKCILNYAPALKGKGYTERTVFNRFGYVYTFLKRHGHRARRKDSDPKQTYLFNENDWPQYEDTPINARTMFSPMARRNVLFPDMFDPLTIRNRSASPNWRSFLMQVVSSKSG